MFFGFNFEYAPQEQFKGEPKSVRVEREEFLDAAGNPITAIRYVQQVIEYRKDGKEAEHRTYRPDGTLSYRDLYEYDDEGRLVKVTTLDDTGTPVCVQEVYRTGPGMEEVVDVGPDGQERSRTMNRRDEAGRPLESTVTEMNKVQAHLAVRYDDQGRPVEAHVTLPGLRMRIGIAYHAGNRTVETWYKPDGTILNIMETSEDEAGQAFSQVLSTHGGIARPITMGRIDSRDSNGNWNQKTILVRNPESQDQQPSAVVHRTITYH